MEDVKSSGDEYGEVTEICDRFLTLQSCQVSLLKNKELLEKQLEEKKAEVTKYEKTMESEVMTIGNDIASLTLKYDKIESLKSELQNDEEESSAKRLAKKSELSQVFFAIDTIESLCSRNTEFH